MDVYGCVSLVFQSYLRFGLLGRFWGPITSNPKVWLEALGSVFCFFKLIPKNPDPSLE